jgi:hypothetical protein
MEHYLDNDENVTGNSGLKGLGGSYNELTFPLLKHEMAKVKHSPKFHLTPEQKNMTLLPGKFTHAAQKDQKQVMTAIWSKYDKGKKPWEFNRIFINGSVDFNYERPGKEFMSHAVLFVINFDKKPYSIDWYDSAKEKWDKVCSNIRDWLVERGLNAQDGSNMQFKEHDEVPAQYDPFTCGQNALKTARALIRGETPDYDTYRAHWAEAVHLYRKYKYGEVIMGIEAHPSMDRIVKQFSEQKVKDWGRMKKWESKQMKGFK